MRHILKRLLKMTAGYGAVQWAGPILSLIFTPILTRILNPSDYGIAEYVLTIASAASTIALFGLPQALTTHFNDKPGNQVWQGRITGSALVLVIVIGTPVSILIFILAPQIAQSALQDSDYAFLFQLIGATTIFGLGSVVLTTAAQAALRVRWGMLFSALTLTTVALGNILFIIVFNWGVIGLLLVPITGSIVVSITAIIVMHRFIGRPSFEVMKLLLRSGVVLLPTMIAGWGLLVVDRIFLVHYVSPDELGYYAIANRIAGLLAVLMTPFYTAWTPLALSIQNEADAKQKYANMARYLVAVALLAALGLALFSKEILMIFTQPAYLPAAPYIGFLTYIHVFSAIGHVLVTGALAGKQLRVFSATVVVGAGVNLFLNFLLIPLYGVWGATIATVIGYGIPEIILYVTLQKRFPIPYSTASLLGGMLVQTCLMVIGTTLLPSSFLLQLGFKILLFSLLPISFFLLGVINQSETRYAWLLARNQFCRAF